MEDFRAALEYGKTVMSESDVRRVESELEDAERMAIKERQKEQDYYTVLGERWDCGWS